MSSGVQQLKRFNQASIIGVDMTSQNKSVNVAAVPDNRTKDELQKPLTGVSSVSQDVNVSEVTSGEGIFFQNRPEASDLSDANWDDFADFFNSDNRTNAPGERTSILQSAFFLDEPSEKDESDEKNSSESKVDTVTEALKLQKHDAFDDFNEWDLFDSANTIANLPCIQPQTPEMKKLLESSNKSSEIPPKSGTNPGISAICDDSSLPTAGARKEVPAPTP